MNENIYLPHVVTIKSMEPETMDVTTFQIVPDGPEAAKCFDYQPGQFMEISVFGVGEVPISIASSPTGEDALEFSIRRVGQVTDALHELRVGDKVGIRGPYGTPFPLGELKGRNLVIIGGGIGLAPLRSLIYSVFDNRENYGKVDIIYGARSPQDLVFKSEFKAWQEFENTEVYLTVDRGDEEWTGNVGLVPAFLREVNPSPENTAAITCGPPIMIKFVLQTLKDLGFPSERIITTLERKMKCGVGKCGRCSIGSKFVCLDGPVFTLKQLEEMPGSW